MDGLSLWPLGPVVFAAGPVYHADANAQKRSLLVTAREVTAPHALPVVVAGGLGFGMHQIVSVAGAGSILAGITGQMTNLPCLVEGLFRLW